MFFFLLLHVSVLGSVILDSFCLKIFIVLTAKKPHCNTQQDADDTVEVFRLLGYSTVQSGESQPTFQRNM
jgi:hypothetical protein